MSQAIPPNAARSTNHLGMHALPTLVLTIGVLLTAIGATDLGFVAIFAVAFLGILAAKPAAFLGIMMGIYGSVQFILQDSFQIGLGSFSLNAAKLFVSLVTSLFLLRVLAGLIARTRYAGFTPSQILYFVFVLWSFFSAAHVYNGPEVATILARLVACGAAMWFAFFFVRSTHDLLWLSAGAAVAVAISSLVALHSFAQGDFFDVIRVGAFRAVGGFGGAVVTGTVAFFGVALAACALTSRLFAKRWTLLWSACLTAGSIGVVTTFTRTAIVGILVFVFLSAFWGDQLISRTVSFARRATILGIFILSFIGAFSFVSEDAIESRLSDIPGFSDSSDVAAKAGSGRGLIWRVVFTSMGRATPIEWILGHGVGSVPAVVHKHTGLPLGAHNSYIEVLHDSGLIGLTLYILFALRLLKDLRADARTATPPLRAFMLLWHHYCVAYFLSTVMFNGYVYMIGPTWFTMIMTGALLGLARSTAAEASTDVLPRTGGA